VASLTLKLRKNSDNVAEFIGLINEVTAQYINNATVSITLYDELGVAVTNADHIEMSYISSTNGNYRGYIPYTANVEEASYAVVDISGDGLRSQITVNVSMVLV